MHETKYDPELFAELYDTQPQVIIWMRPLFAESDNSITDFEYVYSNQEGLKYLNLRPEDFSGLSLMTTPTLNDELRNSLFSDLVNVYTTGVPSVATVFNPVLDKYARIYRTKLRDGILNIVQDITEERSTIRQLEEKTQQLEEQKTLLANILKNSSNGISVSEIFRDSNGKVIDALTIMANDAAVKYIGLPREIYLSKKATEIEPSIIGSPYYQACIKTLETGEPFVTQYFVEASGRWLELTVSKLDYNHLIQVFSDVTSVKQVQLELEKAATTLKSVFDSAQTGMFTFVPVYNDKNEIADFKFEMVNTAIAQYFDQQPESLAGESGSKWFPGFLANGVFDMIRLSFETGQPHRQEIHYNVDGLDNYLDVQSVKIGELLLVSMTDHTSLRKSQLELEQTIRALERSNNNLEDFAHAASHDLKEPLRKIRTFTDRLKTTLSDRMEPDELTIFERIEVAAARMQMLVDDLLEFSHVSEKPQQLEQVDLNEKVARVLADLELAIEEKEAEVRMENLPTVFGNRRQLQQLFQNIISNALKYTRPEIKPVISLTSRIVKADEVQIPLPPESQNASYHLIEIKDNGIGFDQQYAEQIFKMFQRLHGKSEFSGTGVGLSIARKVVDNHNGFIWAEGEVDKGACFKIMLPVS